MSEQEFDPIARETPTGEPSPQEEELIDAEIRHRAHEISQSEEAASDDDNWLRAEREVRERRAATGG
jgi:hypothetical protein